MKTFSLIFLLTICLTTLWAVSTLSAQEPELWVEYPGAGGACKGKRIVLIAGDEEYRTEESMPMLGQILSQRHGFDCTVLFPVDPKTGLIAPAHQTNIPGMHRIEGADLVVLGLRFRHLPDEQMKHFVKYVESGKPVIGFRTATHAFNYPKNSTSSFKHYSFSNRDWQGGFGRQVLGETWAGHHGKHKQESTRGIIEQGQQDNPILNGVDDVWGTTDVYGVKHLPETATVLLRGQVLKGMKPDDPPVEGKKNDPMMPLAWTKPYETENGQISRIFCTTMGAATDFQSEGLRRLLVNACYWGVGLEDSIPEKADVDYVSEYDPTDYGFNKSIKGVKPADHQLGTP